MFTKLHHNHLGLFFLQARIDVHNCREGLNLIYSPMNLEQESAEPGCTSSEAEKTNELTILLEVEVACSFGMFHCLLHLIYSPVQVSC